MADIELVIKIPEEIYKHIMSMQFYIPGARNGKTLLEKILKAIRTGTPLPKGHGDLIDRKALLNRPYEKGGFVEWYDEIKHTTPIIEADKGESEDKE